MIPATLLTRRCFLSLLISFTTVAWMAACCSAVVAQNQPSGGMMRFPDVSANTLSLFMRTIYGSSAARAAWRRPWLSPRGRERFPRFSPDGQSIAFTGNYDGNYDIYIIPVAGGVAARLTYHPATEMVCDWLPDGKTVLYASNGLAGLERQPQLFTISAEKPLPRQLPVPYGTNGTVSSDGKWLAYTPHSRDSRTWKRYRGGMASDIWLFHLEDHTSKQITDFEGTDSLPMWHGQTVYYLSDGGPEARLNIWKYDTATGAREQITKFADFDCKTPAIGPGANGDGEIVFSNGADLKLLDLKSGESRSISVTIPGDRPTLRPMKIDASKFANSGDISPKAKRVCVEARGDIWTLPAKHGMARNLTRTAGAAERSPAWSPDGRWIAYFSDKTGEYELFITQSDGRGETRQLTSDGSCFRYDPIWSPDSKHIVFTDKTGAIFLHTIDGETKLIDTDPYAEQANVRWSHESSWLTYAIMSDEKAPKSIVYVYNVAEGTRHQITSGFFNDGSPTFDQEGKFLYFSGSRSFNNPDYEDVGTSFIYSDTEVILAVPLRADVELPMLPESDEEEWDKDDASEKKPDEDTGAEQAPGESDESGDEEKDPKRRAWQARGRRRSRRQQNRRSG